MHTALRHWQPVDIGQDPSPHPPVGMPSYLRCDMVAAVTPSQVRQASRATFPSEVVAAHSRAVHVAAGPIKQRKRPCHDGTRTMGSQPRDPNHGIRTMGSEPWDPNHGIRTMGSEPRDPNHGIRTMGSEPWDNTDGRKGRRAWVRVLGSLLGSYRSRPEVPRRSPRARDHRVGIAPGWGSQGGDHRVGIAGWGSPQGGDRRVGIASSSAHTVHPAPRDVRRTA